MAYKFQFRDVFAQRDAILDGLILTLELSVTVIALGFVIGRTSGRHSPDAHLFSRVVQSGGAIVSVQCSDQECELAAQVLDGAGAREVRDEAGPEAV